MPHPKFHFFFLVLLLLALFFSSSTSFPKPPPLPVPPLPSSNQLSWQLSEMALFFHFGTNTFTDSEWGTGHADPSVFNPSQLNATQWVKVAVENGFSRVILTAKHHDGFCLWPSKYTNYTVASSLWRNGEGDVVAELADAASAAGIELGVYLSPWDRHEESYGKTKEYNEFYLGQMTELLTSYGEVKEVWLDGAKGEGEKDMQYFFELWFEIIHQIQPKAVIFSDAGPDTRWVGEEAGFSDSTCWSLLNKSSVTIGGSTNLEYLQRGDPYGVDWVPPECDVSIRQGWFWHNSQHPKSAIDLLDLYYKSVGRNCLLLLNVPPNSFGLISDEDIQVLQKFTVLRQNIFSNNLARNANITTTSIWGGINSTNYSPYNILQDGIFTYWAADDNASPWEIYMNFKRPLLFNVLQIQEPIHMGQRIIRFHIDVQISGVWNNLINGTTVGYKRLLQFSKVKSQFLRFVVDECRSYPLISYLGVYLDPYSTLYNASSTANYILHFNNSHIHRRALNFTTGLRKLWL